MKLWRTKRYVVRLHSFLFKLDISTISFIPLNSGKLHKTHKAINRLFVIIS